MELSRFPAAVPNAPGGLVFRRRSSRQTSLGRECHPGCSHEGLLFQGVRYRARGIATFDRLRHGMCIIR
jgi:hypothetical protein